MALKFIDVYSGSGVGLATEPNSQGTIVKATQGLGYVNPICNAQYSAAKKAGRLLGLYHYAGGNDAKKEAQYFINNIKNYVGEAVLVLDWESYQNKAYGNKNWALTFAKEVYRLTGVWPLIYASISALSQVANCASNCGLWVAGYPTNNHSWTVPDFAAYCKRHGYSLSPWKSYTLWQFTGGDMDRSVAAVDADGWKKIANPSGKASTSKPATPAEKPDATKYSTSGKTVYAMATDVLNGEVGNGTTREKNLGKYATSIQASVNYRAKAISSAELYKILAAQVKNGVFGSGSTRKKILGSYYDGTQKVINGTTVKKATTRTYTIKSGDTLSSIGSKLGVAWKTLASKNGIKAPKYVIYAGQKLKY